MAPELEKLAEQGKNMTSVSSKIRVRHHSLSATYHEDKGVEQLTTTIKSFANPLSDADTGIDHFNLVTKVVMPEIVMKDLRGQRDIGMKLFDSFVKERINSGTVNL